jgi:hypothetical protein
MRDLSDVRPAFSAVVHAERLAGEACRPWHPNRQICAQTTAHLTVLTEIHTRHRSAAWRSWRSRQLAEPMSPHDVRLRLMCDTVAPLDVLQVPMLCAHAQ